MTRFTLVLVALAACGNSNNATTDGGRDSAGAHDGSISDGNIGDSGIAGMACTSPTFVTSSQTGGENDGGYYIFNNMWNTAVPLGPETLSACSYHSWYVVSNQTSSAGAVKTYPNVQMNFNDVAISSLTTIASTFAETTPHVGIYEDAYDIWTNGIATSGSTEFMIWVDNYNQVPAGDKVATMTFGARSYDVWKTTDNSYIAFVATTNFTSGEIDLLAIFTYAISQGWLPSTSTLSQIDFGAEICSTNGADATFQFTDFSITAS